MRITVVNVNKIVSNISLKRNCGIHYNNHRLDSGMHALLIQFLTISPSLCEVASGGNICTVVYTLWFVGDDS